MSTDQPAPTPRTLDDLYIRLERAQQECKHGNKDSANRCIQCTMKETERLERELSAKTAEAERLREALLFAAETFRQINEGKHDPFSFDLRSNMRSAAGRALEKTRAALAATRKDGVSGA